MGPAEREVREAIRRAFDSAVPPIPAHGDVETAFGLLADELIAVLFDADGTREAVADLVADRGASMSEDERVGVAGSERDELVSRAARLIAEPPAPPELYKPEVGIIVDAILPGGFDAAVERLAYSLWPLSLPGPRELAVVRAHLRAYHDLGSTDEA